MTMIIYYIFYHDVCLSSWFWRYVQLTMQTALSKCWQQLCFLGFVWSLLVFCWWMVSFCKKWVEVVLVKSSNSREISGMAQPSHERNVPAVPSTTKKTSVASSTAIRQTFTGAEGRFQTLFPWGWAITQACRCWPRHPRALDCGMILEKNLTFLENLERTSRILEKK